jgi:hypothetical protein
MLINLSLARNNAAVIPFLIENNAELANYRRDFTTHPYPDPEEQQFIIDALERR